MVLRLGSRVDATVSPARDESNDSFCLDFFFVLTISNSFHKIIQALLTKKLMFNVPIIKKLSMSGTKSINIFYCQKEFTDITK